MIRIGIALEEERKRQNLTLVEVAKATKIREEFLKAIERGDYKKLPGSSYAHGFVRNYAKFLGLPVEKSIAILRRELDEKKTYEVLPRGLTYGKLYSKKLRFGRNVILVTSIFLVMSAFLLFQYRGAFLNPALSVEKPTESQTLNSLTIEVFGKTDPDATLIIDGEAVSVDSNGNFKKEITVFPGHTSINFEAENRFGRVTSLKRNIIVSPGK